MKQGLDVNAVPRTMMQYPSQDDDCAPGYGQAIVEAQIQTEDDNLRDRIKTLSSREVLIL